MHPVTVALLKDKRCKDVMLALSAKELHEFDDSIYDASVEKTDENGTDMLLELGSEIRRALTGRYRIFRKMTDDQEYWLSNKDDFAAFSGSFEHEPYIVATALAIRPVEEWEWNIVEEWSWVYRHAELLDINIGDFAEWCADQDPKKSRALIMKTMSYFDDSTPSVAANGNA